MLTTIVPARYRKIAYALYGFIGLIIGATQVAYSSAGSDQPTWLTVVLAVFAFVGTALGFTASANTDPNGD